MATSTKDAWKAVVIVAGESACAPAKQLDGKRFLSRSAPRLPLPECTQQDRCQCKYRHMRDRRGAQRRGEDIDALRRPSAPITKERRRPGERRERRR